MIVLTVEELKQLKYNSGLSCETIAERSGVPLSTVQKVFSGVTRRPRAETLQRLMSVFQDNRDRTSDEPGEFLYHVDSSRSLRVEESAPDYGHTLALEPAFEPGSRAPFQRQGTYTIEDYYRVPDDRRVELIDGVFYDMNAPRPVHQHLALFIGTCIYNYIQENDGDCVPFMAPTDVRLDILSEDRTMVQPDVFIVCDEEKLDSRLVKGGPDFVVEVLSPSTRRKDITKKTAKYADAGVREYWIIDPKNATITVYDFEHDCEVINYRFGESVPVRIYDGDLVIDFGKMPRYLVRLYDDEWNLREPE